MSASWNSKNRRVAKQLSKSNWYKGKSEVQPPTPSSHQGGKSSQEDVNQDTRSTGDHTSTGDAENAGTLNTTGEKSNKGNYEQIDERIFQKAGQDTGRSKRKKKRGSERPNITLGGLKKVEMAMKRKEKRKLNKKLGIIGILTTRKNRKGQLPPTRSVMFLDNTANAELIKRMQKVEEEMVSKPNGGSG